MSTPCSGSADGGEGRGPTALDGSRNNYGSYGGQVIGPGVPTVLITGLPAAVVSDQTTCPLSSGTPPNEVPHVGGPILTGSATVMIGGRPAARVGDSNVENGPPATIITGAFTVLIGP
jgi:uncharacterized Zn-binding protein involved in type VI secretion